MGEMWLPIGSVVLLEEGKKLVMIYGRAQRQVDTEAGEPVLWDYVGCLYPEGNLNPEYNYLFNREQIEKVFFVGYQSVEEYEYSKQLDELMLDYRDTAIDDDERGR